jgi:hypothetical protein
MMIHRGSRALLPDKHLPGLERRKIMKRPSLRPTWTVVIAGAATLLLAGGTAAAAAPSTPNVTVFASGLNNPRGLTFGPDGDLYVAEGGTGGTTSTVGQCTQVVPPVGPYTGGFTSRISEIDPNGVRTTVADNLPSSQTSPALGTLVSGVSDVAFLGGQLYALEAGAGCSHGLAGTDNSILRVNADGTTTQVADLSQFLKSHPIANPDPADFEPDGTWYSMAAKGNALYALEPNHQEMDRIQTANGHISRVVDFSKTFVAPADWRGPTTITRDGGSFYVGTLTPFPIVPGSAQVFKVNPGGHFTLFASGLTTVLGLAVDSSGRLYALESMTVAGFPGPQEIGMGKVVRIDPSGAQTVIATGLSFPSAMTFGPDGALYVSNFGFGAPAGAGQILRITVPS